MYKLTKRRSETKGLDTSDSLQFEVYNTNNGDKVKFKIDMNIKSNSIITCEYSPILNMNTYDALTMLSDKIVVVSSEKIFRRVKDLYDLCVIVSMYNINYLDIINHLNVKHPNVQLKNMLKSSNFEDIGHAYSKYQGIENKPNIEVLFNIALTFLYPIYQKIEGNMIWNSQTLCWMVD